ncbi:MAG: hypothetical protein HQ581_13755 [Planctomycetes bacterium]|nr:hypothetical protein [Planctomycetota bacterium]
MTVDWQNIVVSVLVLGAIAMVARHLWRLWSAKCSTGCGTCQGCSKRAASSGCDSRDDG